MAEGDLVVERALDAGCTAVVALVDAAKPPPVTARLRRRRADLRRRRRVRAMVTQLGMPQGDRRSLRSAATHHCGSDSRPVATRLIAGRGRRQPDQHRLDRPQRRRPRLGRDDRSTTRAPIRWRGGRCACRWARRSAFRHARTARSWPTSCDARRRRVRQSARSRPPDADDIGAIAVADEAWRS